MGGNRSKAEPIVLVMDDDFARAGILKALARAGYSSVAAIDRGAAVAYLMRRPRPPGTIVLDATSRGQTLNELMNALANIPGLEAVPVWLIRSDRR